MLRPGEVVEGRFRVDDIVGRGRASTVYRAQDTTQNREVAVKVADWDIGTPTEAVTPVVPLRHPNIVGVHSITPLPIGRTSIAMELVQGGHLAAMLRHGPLKADWARFVVEECARALAHAHANGVVHADIRPENIVVLQPNVGHEQVKLAGYDGALVARLTSTGRGPTLGATRFAAPEQRHSGRATPASDVYSLASTVWFATTGASHTDPAAHTLAAAIPDDLRQILWRCLSPLPRDRYADGAALLAALVAPQHVAGAGAAGTMSYTASRTAVAGGGVVLGIVVASCVVVAALSVISVGLVVGQQVADDVVSPVTNQPDETRIIGEEAGRSAGGAAPGPAVAPSPTPTPDPVSAEVAMAPPQPAVEASVATDPEVSKAASPVADVPVARTVPVVARRGKPPAARPGKSPAAVVAPVVAAPEKPVLVPAVGGLEPAPAPNPDRALRALVGVSTWAVGGLDRTESLTLSIARDGSVFGTVRGSGLAGPYARGLAGVASPRDGQVHVQVTETRRVRPRTFDGLLTPDQGSGTVLVSGRPKGTWSVDRSGAERDTGATTD